MEAVCVCLLNQISGVPIRRWAGAADLSSVVEDGSNGCIPWFCVSFVKTRSDNLPKSVRSLIGIGFPDQAEHFRAIDAVLTGDEPIVTDAEQLAVQKWRSRVWLLYRELGIYIRRADVHKRDIVIT